MAAHIRAQVHIPKIPLDLIAGHALVASVLDKVIPVSYTHLDVYKRQAQELINAGGIASVKPREAELLCVSIDVERIQFNRGFYSVDIRFFYRIECEISCRFV